MSSPVTKKKNNFLSLAGDVFQANQVSESAIVDDELPKGVTEMPQRPRRKSSLTGPALDLGPPVHGEGFRPRADSNLSY